MLCAYTESVFVIYRMVARSCYVKTWLSCYVKTWLLTLYMIRIFGCDSFNETCIVVLLSMSPIDDAWQHQHTKIRLFIVCGVCLLCTVHFKIDI